MQVHLVDGTYELFRHHFAVPSHLDPDGMEVAATRGVVGSVLMMLEGGATHVGVATDHVVESFRNELWPGYKTSAGMDPELLAQFPVHRGRAARPRRRGVGDGRRRSRRRAGQRGRGRGGRRARRARDHLHAGQGPRASASWATGSCSSTGAARPSATKPASIAKFGVPPESIPDYLALVGDTADGFPGIPGWGAKSTGDRARALPAPRGDPDAREGLGRRRARRDEARHEPRRPARDDADLFKMLAILRVDADVGHGRRLALDRAGARLRRLVRAARRTRAWRREPTSWRNEEPKRTMTSSEPPTTGADDAVVIDRVRPEVAVVRMNRPDRRNAMNYPLLSGLYGAFEELREDPECRVIVLTGAGQGFCAGLDLVRRGGDAAHGGARPPPGRDAGPAVHRAADPHDAQPAATDHRRGQRCRFGWGSRADARQRHPHRGRVRALQRRVHQGRAVRVRHRDELDPAPAHRRVACRTS